MAKLEQDACRLCYKYVEPVHMMDLINVCAEVVDQIKEVIGVELINYKNVPSSICRQCYDDFENAREFQRKCIESNKYFTQKSQQYQCDGVAIEEPFIETKYSDGETENSEENPLECPLEFKTEQEELDAPRSSPTKCIKSENASGQRERKPYTKKAIIEGHQNQRSIVSFICDICGNSFKAKHVLAMHLRRHGDNKPHECELCPSSFYTYSELNRHMRRHTGEKPYECKYCHRKFSDYGTHTKHERTHTNDRPFACDQCHRSFSYNFVLKNHMLTHTGVRAFRCEVCDKSFGRQHNLTTHLKSILHQKNILQKKKKNQ